MLLVAAVFLLPQVFHCRLVMPLPRGGQPELPRTQVVVVRQVLLVPHEPVDDRQHDRGPVAFVDLHRDRHACLPEHEEGRLLVLVPGAVEHPALGRSENQAGVVAPVVVAAHQVSSSTTTISLPVALPRCLTLPCKVISCAPTMTSTGSPASRTVPLAI